MYILEAERKFSENQTRVSSMQMLASIMQDQHDLNLKKHCTTHILNINSVQEQNNSSIKFPKHQEKRLSSCLHQKQG